MFNKIINSCKCVMNNSKFVMINYDKLNSFITKINNNEIKNWLSNNPNNILAFDIETIVNLLLVFEAVDYSFWGEPKWTIQTPSGVKDGTDALLSLLIDYVKQTGNTDFSKISFHSFKNLFKGNVGIPLLRERYKTIVATSKIVNEKMNGNFYNYIKNVTIDSELFDIVVNNFSSFKDERKYKGKTIYFYKLAQLLTSDILHIREQLEKIKVDYSHLVGCADYKIPQTLRALGIIEYNDKLAKIIDMKKEIKISSKYEVEIRASQLVVINYIAKKLGTASININDYLYLYSSRIKDKIKPYHRCRNTNY